MFFPEYHENDGVYLLCENRNVKLNHRKVFLNLMQQKNVTMCGGFLKLFLWRSLCSKNREQNHAKICDLQFKIFQKFARVCNSKCLDSR